MLESDSFWALVGLILFFVVVFAVGAPKRVIATLDKRTDRIKTELAEAKKAREEAQALLAEYQRKRRDAEAEAAHILEEARNEARRLSEEADAKLRDMVDRRTRAAELKISQAEAQAIAEVRSRAANLAVAAASDVLSDKLKGEPGAEMVERSISTVRERLH
ncbi:MAG: ATP F0F1 synthase subunit B [Pseudomonadota bacterium]